MVQRFDVVGMSCGHCVRAVTEAVRDLDQAAVVQIDLPTGTVTVQSDVATAMAEAVLNAPMGSLADRLGRRRLMVLAAVIQRGRAGCKAVPVVAENWPLRIRYYRRAPTGS